MKSLAVRPTASSLTADELLDNELRRHAGKSAAQEVRAQAPPKAMKILCLWTADNKPCYIGIVDWTCQMPRDLHMKHWDLRNLAAASQKQHRHYKDKDPLDSDQLQELLCQSSWRLLEPSLVNGRCCHHQLCGPYAESLKVHGGVYQCLGLGPNQKQRTRASHMAMAEAMMNPDSGNSLDSKLWQDFQNQIAWISQVPSEGS